uniref:Uncharacterized protein n=1 Tax=Rhizophora mucronata TaxID=61149 RepID=A0A2P2J480_RHIMU
MSPSCHTLKEQDNQPS